MRRLQKVVTTISTTQTNNTIGTGTVTGYSGYIRGIKVKSPASVDSAATLTTAITDDDGDSLVGLASGFTGQAANGTVKQYADTQTQPNPLGIPVAGNLTITATLSANQTVARSVVVTLYIDSFL